MPDVSDADRKAADSGFTPENIADAEWLWMNVNVDHRKFHELPTHHKALLCHTAARHHEAGRLAGMEEAAVALEADAKLCDCSAYEENECACGAWCEWKTITSARAVEIVRAAKGEGNG